MFVFFSFTCLNRKRVSTHKEKKKKSRVTFVLIFWKEDIYKTHAATRAAHYTEYTELFGFSAGWRNSSQQLAAPSKNSVWFYLKEKYRSIIFHYNLYVYYFIVSMVRNLHVFLVGWLMIFKLYALHRIIYLNVGVARPLACVSVVAIYF